MAINRDNFENDNMNIKLSQHSISEVLSVVKLTSESINKSILNLQENTKAITLILQDIVKETNKMPLQATREEIKDYMRENITPELVKLREIINGMNNDMKTLKKDSTEYNKNLTTFVINVSKIIDNFDKKLFRFLTWTGVIFAILCFVFMLLGLGLIHFG